MLFLFLALWALIIFDASAYGILAPVSIPAAERTAKINAAGIPWMGEKQYVAMPASRQTFSQVGLFFDNGADNPIVLRNNTSNLFSTVPVRNKLKTGLYLYYKKANCSLISLMYLGMPSLRLLYFAINRYNGGSFFVKQKSILNKSEWRDITEKGVST